METLGDFLASGADDCDSMLQEVVDSNPQLKQEVEKVHARARVSQAWMALRAARSQALSKSSRPVQPRLSPIVVWLALLPARGVQRGLPTPC